MAENEKLNNVAVDNDVVFDLHVDLHDVAAFEVADFADGVGILQLADVAGVGEVIHNFFRVIPHNFILILSNYNNILTQKISKD